MKDVEYTQYQQQILITAGFILQMDKLPEFLQAIQRADTLGPIMDPTLWQKGHKEMYQIEEIAAAINDARIRIRKVAEEAGIDFEQIGKASVR